MELRRLDEWPDGAQGPVTLMQVEDEIRSYYEKGVELDRLMQGYSRIEFERTKELLARHLPPPPARLLDVGGGPGVYAEWLAEAGYDVRLVDASPLHVRQALERSKNRFAAVEGDARSLDEADESYDVVLLLGPLYHLTERDDRLRALREAGRVLRPGGLVAAAAISRFASLLDGLYGGYLTEPMFWPVVERDLADGQHRSPPDADAPVFTTAYFHRPEELRAELEEAGFPVDGVFGVEGPGWLLGDRWEDERAREHILRIARALEQEPTVIGTSSHLLVVARKPEAV
jgi:ubiquinone/menaquinone biosynthesis C-methylase UbiE